MSKQTVNTLAIVGAAVAAVGVIAAGIVVANKCINKKKEMKKFDGVTEDDIADILPTGAEA